MEIVRRSPQGCIASNIVTKKKTNFYSDGTLRRLTGARQAYSGCKMRRAGSQNILSIEKQM